MDIILRAIEDIIYFYEESPAAKRYGLSKDEYLFLRSLSQGYDTLALADYYDRNETYVYKIRKRVIHKFAVKTLHEVMYCFGRLDGKKS